MRRREKALERECFRERVVNSVCDEKNRRNQEVPRQNRPCFYSLYGFVLCIFNFNYFFVLVRKQKAREFHGILWLSMKEAVGTWRASVLTSSAGCEKIQPPLDNYATRYQKLYSQRKHCSYCTRAFMAHTSLSLSANSLLSPKVSKSSFSLDNFEKEKFQVIIHLSFFNFYLVSTNNFLR